MVRFATEGAARDFADASSAQATDRTVAAAVAAYMADCRARGLADTTLATYEYRLAGLLQTAAHDGGPLVKLTARRAETLLADRRGSVVNRRLELALASIWARWCERQGWIDHDPFDGLAVVGKAAHGKPQLRVDEARVFAAHCRRRAAAGDQHALAVLLALVFGRRASEITSRLVRDLDDRGRVLWIPLAKTAAGRVQLEVPDNLRQLLLRQARGRDAHAPLFPGQQRHTLHHHCQRLCREAGVTVVGPQSLRGLHATLARPLVSTPALVSAALGHTGQAVTERHYYEPGELERDRQRRAQARLTGAPARKGKRP